LVLRQGRSCREKKTGDSREQVLYAHGRRPT